MHRILSSNYSLFGLFFISLSAAGLFAGVSILQILLFVYIQVAGILLPGYLVIDMAGYTFKNLTAKLFTGYGVGYGMLAILYAILLLLNVQTLSPYFLYAISLVSMVTVLHKKREVLLSLRANNDDNRYLLVFFAILVVFCFAVYQFPLRSASGTGYLDMHFDHTYWFKNCVASTKGYPLQELSVLGNNLCWHLFSCFNIALLHFSTGIEIYDLCFSLSYVWHVFLLLAGSYTMLNEALKFKKSVLIAIILILFCSSAEPYTYIFYLDHLYVCTLGEADGLSLSMFAMLLCFKAVKDCHINWHYVPLAVLMFVATIGSKSANGVVLLTGVFCALSYIIIKNRSTMVSAFSVMMVYAALFVLVCKIFVIDGNALISDTSSHHLILNFRTVITPDINHSIVERLENIGIRPFVSAMILALPYLMVTHPAMPLLVITLTGLFCRRKDIRIFKEPYWLYALPSLVMSLSGIIIFFSISHPGFSQNYFIFACIPFAVLFSFMVIENCFLKAFDKYVCYLYFVVGCSVLATLVCARDTFVLDGKYSVPPAQLSREGTSVTRNELAGLRWARANLPEDAVILTNKVLAPVRGERSFITSVYSERQVYLEGYISTNLPNDHIVADRLSLIRSYLGGDKLARETLRKEGVSHVIIFKSISDSMPKHSRLLYENDEIAIMLL